MVAIAVEDAVQESDESFRVAHEDIWLAAHVVPVCAHESRVPADASSSTLPRQGAGLTGKAAKLSSRALTDKLKALSRSPAKGGLQPYRDPDTGTAQLPHAGNIRDHQGMTAEQLQEQEEMEAELEQMAAAFGPAALQQHRQDRAAAKAAAALPLARTKSGRLKASAKAALLDHIAQHGMLSVPHEHLRIALDLPPSATLNSPSRAAELKQATPAYSESQALAYAVGRLPGCYAAASRVFKELQLRAAGFKPRSMLDLGAGPGTAIWAAQEVWPDSLRHVTAVEPSDAMRRMGVRLEAARRFAHESSPLVRWQAELPQQRPPGRQAQHKHRYDLVVAGYVLGEVASPAERAALRPAFMQAAKAGRGCRANPADHQDERYSYVVLRRGQRAASVPAVDISRSFHLKSSAVRHDLSKQDGQAIRSRGANIAVLQDPAGGAAAADDGVEEDLSEGSMLPNSSAAQAGLLTAEELQQLSALLGAPAGQQRAESPRVSLTAPSIGMFSSSLEESNPEMQSHDKGVISRLIALEDAGINWTAHGTKDLAAQLTEMGSSVMAAGSDIAACTQSVQEPVAIDRENGSCSDHVQQQEQQLEIAVTRTVDSGSQQQPVGGAAEIATAVASSASWS
eukprot:gene1372-1714_t